MLFLAESNLVTAIVTAAAGLAGVVAGGGITALNQRRERRNNRLREQLQTFYSPLLGMHLQVRAKSEVRVKVSNIAQASWPDLFRGVESPQIKQRIQDESEPQYVRLIEYSNAQLTNEIVPLYRDMLEHFTKNLWLAEPSTVSHYAALIEYVEMWNRFLDGSLPKEVLDKVEHKEERLKPLYADLKEQFERLRRELKEEPRWFAP